MHVPENGKAHFYAFISHKSTDDQFALKLQKFIETYNLPAHIRRLVQSPAKRLAPVCSYEVDFSSNPLLEEMRDKLNRSDYLILICSKELVQSGSKYVDYEIRTFIECKREQGINPLTRIIPIIVSGEFDSPEQECCPQALKELGDNRPIALVRSKYRNDRTLFLHVIAAMLDIDHTVMLNRDQKRKNIRRIITGTALALFLLTAIGLGEYYIPRQTRYTDFVMKDGLPEGIGRPLRAEDWQQMRGHYVITTCEHKIQSLEYKNAYDNRIDHGGNVFDGDRPSAYVFQYTGAGLSSVTYENKQGQPYFILQYSGESMSAADLRNPYDPSEAFYIGSGYEHDPSMLLSDLNWDSRSDISRFRYETNGEGYVTKVIFCADSTGRLAKDNTIYGFEYELDENGRIVATYFLDALEQRRLNTEGIYCRKFIYNGQNDLVEWINYGKDGMPVANQEGITRCVFSYDDHHNRTGFAFYDADGVSVIVDSYGGAGQRQTVDQRGNLILVELLDTEGNACESYAYCAMAFTYDENGFTQSRTYLNQNGEAVINPDQNYATVRYVNDPNGNPLEVTFYDAKGNLIENAYGYAKEVIEYASDGRTEKHAYFDCSGACADYRGYGYASYVITYDERGREISTSYYGLQGEPVNIKGPSFGFGYHKLETVYEYGAHTKQVQTYYDAAGNPVNLRSSLGEEYAKTVLYIQNGQITYLANFCADGSVFGQVIESETDYTAQAEAVTTIRYTDGDGNLLQESVTYYRLNGVEYRKNFTVYDADQNVVSEQEILYHENGHRQSDRIREYNAAGNITSDYLCEYDEQGVLYKETLTDPTNTDAYTYIVEPVYGQDGIVVEEIHTSQDAEGNTSFVVVYTLLPDGSTAKMETSYLDENGTVYTKTIREYKGDVTVAVMEYTYDTDGTVDMIISRQNHDDGTTATWECWDYDGDVLFAYTRFVYNADGTQTQTTTFYDADGNEIDVSQRILDTDGTVIG